MSFRHLCGAAAVALVALGSQTGRADAGRASQSQAPRSTAVFAAQRALLDGYCVSCHNQRTKTADLTFDTFDLAHLEGEAEAWEKAVRKLRGGMMPPPGARRPDQASVDAFVSWIER